MARELGDGVMSVKEPIADFDWSIVAGSGTVLDDGEEPGARRVLEAVGPYLTMLYHYFYDVPSAVDLDALPGGRAWRERVDAIRRRCATCACTARTWSPSPSATATSSPARLSRC